MLEENSITEAPDGTPTTPVEREAWWALAAIVIVGCFLRCYSIHQHVWIDELHTAWTVSGNYFDLLQRARLGNNASTYFFFVKFVTDVLGLHAWTLRLISVVTGCLIIPLTYWLARSWRCTCAASLLAAALTACDRNAIFYSVEARTYVLVQLFSLVHLYLFSRLLVRSHVSIWIAWVLTGILMFQLHCTAALIFPAEVVAYFAALFLKHESKSHRITLLLGMTVILLGMIPSIDLLREVAERRQNWAMFIRRSRNPLDIVTLLPMYVYLLTPILVAVLAFAVKRFQRINASPNDEVERPVPRNGFAGFAVPLAITASWLFVPLVLAWVLTERDVARLFFPRYLVASSISLALITALLVTWLLPGRRVGLWGSVLVLLVAVCTISPAKYFRYGSGALAHSGESWRQAVELVNDSDPAIPVLLYSGLIEADAWHDSENETERSYCEFPLRSLYQVDTQREVIPLAKSNPDVSPAEVKRISDRGVWLIIRATDERAAEIQKQVLGSLQSGFRQTTTQKFGRIHIGRLRRK